MGRTEPPIARPILSGPPPLPRDRVVVLPTIVVVALGLSLIANLSLSVLLALGAFRLADSTREADKSRAISVECHDARVAAEARLAQVKDLFAFVRESNAGSGQGGK
jgi:hypothetical protein